MLRKLITIANNFDSIGLAKEAEIIDKLLKKVAIDANNSSKRVSAAIQKSIGMPHFDNAFRTRNPSPESEGSTFLTEQTPESLMAATWERSNDPTIKPPAVGFQSEIPGYFGVLTLSELEEDIPVKIVKAHKGTVNEAVCLVSGLDVERPKADFTTILLGPDNDGEIVWTFFPGPAIAPTAIPWDDSLQEAIKTVGDAVSQGFKYGKLSGS